MCVGLTAKESPMNDYISLLRFLMVTNERHITRQQIIFRKPLVDCLSCVVLIGLSGRFDYPSWAKQHAINGRVVEDMDLSVS